MNGGGGMRFKVTSVHGEHMTIWHVVNTEAPEAEQPKIVATFHSPTLAHCYAQDLNIPDAEA